MKKILRLLFPLFMMLMAVLVFLPQHVYASNADSYWVGGSGSWSQASTHWAATSGGAPASGNLPGATTNVHFDSASAAASYTVTIDSAAVCQNMTWDNPSSGSPTLASSSGSLTIYGSLTKVAAMTWTASVTITFAATSGTQNITNNSVAYAGAVTFNGAGGSWNCVDAFNIGASVLTLTNGTLNTNGQAVTTGNFAAASGTSTLTLGATVWNSAGNWTATSLGTLNANTSSLQFTGASTQFTGAGKTYNDVQFNGSGAAAVLDLNTFATLTRTGTAVTTDTLVFSANETINTTFTVTGASVANRVAVKSNTTSARTITSSANMMTNTDFYYIIGQGAASWNFAGNPGGSADMGGNVNLTLTSSVYWVGNSGNWVSGAGSHWSGTSGGTPHADFLPLSTVSTIFDANSITTTSQTVTIEANSNCFNTDWSAVLHNPNIGYTGSAVWNVYGSLTLKSGMTWGPLSLSLRATSAANINIAGAVANFSGWSYSTGFVFVGSGPFTILSNIDMSSTLTTVTINNGAVVNLGNFGITVGESSLGTPLAVNGTLTMGSSTINLSTNNGAGTFSMGSTGNINMGTSTWNISGSGGSSITFTAGGTVTSGTSAINISATNETFSGGGYTFYNLTSSGSNFSMSGNNIFNNVSITGSATTISGANTFNNFTRIGTAALNDSISFGADQIISGTFTVTSNSATNRVLVQSNSQGTLRTFTAGTVVASNVDWSDINGSGASTWNLSAGNNGDAGGNMGITFTTPANIYWFGNTGSWVDATHWFWGSGGTGGNARAPLIQDTAVFDANSFVVPGTLTLTASYRFSSINTSTVSNTPVFSATGPTFYGGNLNITGTTWSVTNTYIYGRNLTTLTTGGVSLQALTIGHGTTNGNLTLNDNPTCTGAVTLLAGALNLNGHTLTAASFDSSTTTYVRALTMGTGNIILNGTGAINKWNAAATNFSFYCGTGTLFFTSSLNNSQSMTLAGLTYYYVIIGGAGTYTMTLNSAFSCYVFAIDRSQAAKTLTGSYTITQTALSIPVSGVTTVTITNTKFSMAAGVFITDYLILTGSTANGGATFYAGSHATNVSGNSGWLFQDFAGIYPTAATGTATSVTASSAVLNGTLTNIGSFTPVSGYFQYDTDGTFISPVSTPLQPLTANGAFSQAITQLNYNVTYYFRAVVVYNTSSYSYGSGVPFTTIGAPLVTTGNAVNISTTGATLQGSLALNNYANVYIYFEYGTTTAYGTSTALQEETSNAAFNQVLTGLSTNIQYHFRADLIYGNNIIVNGSDAIFTTGSLLNPSVTTGTANNITTTSASLQGTLTSIGSYTSIVVYFEYGTSVSYGTSTSAQTLTASGIFQSAITGLNNNVTYHFRANASVGGTVLNGNDATFVAGQGNWTKVVSGNSNAAYWNMVGSTPTAPTHLYTELGTGFLFGGFLQMISNDSGIPLALIVFPYAFYISLLLGLVAYVLSMGRAGKDTAGRRPYRGSLPIMAVVSGLSMTYFVISGGGVIPGWSLIPYGFWAVASIIFRQNQEGRGW